MLPKPYPLRGGIPFSAVTFEVSFLSVTILLPIYCYPMSDISPESLCRELLKLTHYFDLVAMATLLAL